ncbi:MAG: hypothetical protein AAFQ66_20720 [Pseudomonadota bacterium]
MGGLRLFLLAAIVVSVSGCARVSGVWDRVRGDQSEPVVEETAPLDATSTVEEQPAAVITPAGQSADAFDTTTEEELLAATAPPEVSSGLRELGRTIASLGDPTVPGFWAETGLVTQAQEGRLTYPESGKSVTVELRPSGADPSAGSRVSLAAFRALEAPLTDLPELIVLAR